MSCANIPEYQLNSLLNEQTLAGADYLETITITITITEIFVIDCDCNRNQPQPETMKQVNRSKPPESCTAHGE